MSVIAVTGTGSLIGQAIIKSIKCSSYKDSNLIGMDYFENTIGSYWTDSNYLLPDILSDDVSEKDWLERVLSIIVKNRVNILFVGVDFELRIFAKYKQYIEENTTCLIVVSNEKVIGIADDKYLTYQFLKDNKLDHPLTFKESEVDNILDGNLINFPMIVKPRNGYRSIDVYTVNNIIELRDKVIKVENPIIQEYIGTNETEYTCGVIAFNGGVKESIVLRRDLRNGNTDKTYLKYNYQLEIKDYIESVSIKLGQFGACNFQLRVDSDGPKIFEINARHSGTTYIRALYGFNEIEFILNYLLKGEETVFNIKEGIVQRYFEEFFVQN